MQAPGAEETSKGYEKIRCQISGCHTPPGAAATHRLKRHSVLGLLETPNIYIYIFYPLFIYSYVNSAPPGSLRNMALNVNLTEATLQLLTKL